MRYLGALPASFVHGEEHQVSWSPTELKTETGFQDLILVKTTIRKVIALRMGRLLLLPERHRQSAEGEGAAVLHLAA